MTEIAPTQRNICMSSSIAGSATVVAIGAVAYFLRGWINTDPLPEWFLTLGALAIVFGSGVLAGDLVDAVWRRVTRRQLSLAYNTDGSTESCAERKGARPESERG